MDNSSYNRFAKLLTERNITPYRVHKDTGIATATLSDWKNEKSTPKQDEMQKIADYLGVNLEYLTTGKEAIKDFPFSEENAYFIVEVQRRIGDQCFVEHLKKYMELINSNRKSVDDLIDFLHDKEKKEAD